jgi:hypothetical protein
MRHEAAVCAPALGGSRPNACGPIALRTFVDTATVAARAAGTNDDSIAAMYRLRRDERVRSVDIDVRRGLHDRS